ncbi:MAG: hypothetical protein JW913_02945 [Chitinispirillaceae bacterium]|nr:hypothetical protein [Chitinispirillaceae bacterium]
MLRLALVVLAGATFVAAQTTTETTDEQVKQGRVIQQGRDSTKVTPMRTGLDSARFAEKFKEAMDRGCGKADSAREARRELREHMKDSADIDTGKVMDRHRTMKRERLQDAIDALERSSERIGAQVKNEAQGRTQARLMERRDELIQLQQRNREKKETKTETTTETTTEAAE